MNAKPADRAESGDPVNPKPPANRTLAFVLGLLALVGAALALCFLLFEGGLLLAIGFLFEIISHLAPPARGPEVFDSMLILPAVMVVSGLCLAFGLLDIAFRAFTRKPFPSGSTLLRFCLISLTLIVATVTAVITFTRTTAG